MYNHLVSATLFAVTFYFQKIATTSMSLLHCVKISQSSVLHIDGTIECYQLWQSGPFAFVFGWVVPFVGVLMFGPGLLVGRKISVSEFFLSCFLPIPFLSRWIVKSVQKSWRQQGPEITQWQIEVEDELHKTYKNISLKYVGSVCWIGVTKFRRFFLVIIFTFTQNLVLRLGLMLSFTVLFLCLHLILYPYRDKRANRLFSVSLLATILLGLVNGVRAVLVEGLIEIENTKPIVEVCEFIQNIVMIWVPVCAIALGGTLKCLRKVPWQKMKCYKHQEGEQIELQQIPDRMSV